MEDEKSKKKRNNKKKKNSSSNKQGKVLDEFSIDGGDSVSEDQNPASSEVESVSIGNGDKDSDFSLGGANGKMALLESEKQQWLQKEAIFKETVRQLQIEKDSDRDREAIVLESEKQKWLQREAILQETIKQLQIEKDSVIQREAILRESEKQKWLQREAVLEETIRHLQLEKDSRIQEEANLLDTVTQLRKENNLHLQKELYFEESIRQLQAEKNSCCEKENQLEEKLSQLVDEKNTLYLKEVSLEERIKLLEEEKHSWVSKEESNKISTGNLNDDIARLQAQVVEVEESRNSLLHKNRQLTEYISNLQLQIKDVQSIGSTQSSDELTKIACERDELNSQVDSAFALIERLMEENAELVEKVSELLVELDRNRGSSDRASTTAPELVTQMTETAFMNQVSETNGDMPKSFQAIDVVPVVTLEGNGVHNTNTRLVDVIPEPSKHEYISEIVQVPLEENDVRDLELQDVMIDERDSVPLMDAPLIGAPFRLISFVSRYVTGADLVDKSSLQV